MELTPLTPKKKTIMKKEYSKPTIEVLEMEVQQMICQSTTFTQPLTEDDYDENNSEEYWSNHTHTGVFD